MKFSRAFTMIELIFVIVVLGILAAVAFPRLAATRTDAEITKGRADVATIRSAIVSERQTQLIKGTDDDYCDELVD
jgi:general secretion pathway protein G